MPMLMFMPWCPIKKRYGAGWLELLPFVRDKRTEPFDELTHCRISTVMASYRDLAGYPVAEAAVLKWKEKEVLADLTDDEIAQTYEGAEVLCFAGLASRKYFSPLGPYCNTDSFRLYGQRFRDVPGFGGFVSRRREGQNIDGRELAETLFSIPLHAARVHEAVLDEALLSALSRHRDSVKDDEWSRWQNAISCYIQGNTDSEAVPQQVEWVLMVSAFEHLLSAQPIAKDVADKFAAAMVPSAELAGGRSKRLTGSTHQGCSVRHSWMREFYRVRGDFAHGRLQTKQPTIWRPAEHIFLASWAFPLLARCLLRKAGQYTLTDDDQTHTDAFEPLADEDFLNPPARCESDFDWWWHRKIEDARWLAIKPKLRDAL